MAGFLLVATLLIVGFLCALKIRKHSKSMKVPLSITLAFGKPNHNLPALSESTAKADSYRIKTCTKVSV